MTSAVDRTGTDRHRTRSVLGVFVVVMLNLVAQPCAMALGDIEEHDCPRCPPSHNDEHAHHAMRGHEMHGHEAASSGMPCATDATNCSLAEELNYDGRATKLEPKDAPSDSPTLLQTSIVNTEARRPAVITGWHSTRSPPPIPSTPLNVIHCVYLK